MPSPIPAISEDYSDIIVKKQLLPFRIEERYQEQPVDRQYSILYAPLSENLYAAHQIGYIGVPKLYTFISLSSSERFRHPFSPDTALSQTPRNRNSHRFSRLRHRLPASRLPKSRRNDQDRCSMGLVRFNRNCTGRFPMAVNIRRIPSIRHSFRRSLSHRSLP